MSALPLAAAIIVGLVSGIFLNESAIGIVVLALLAGIGGGLAPLMRKGAERVYWGVLFILVLVLALSYFGVNLGRWIMIAPLILAFGYFVARCVGRFTGMRDSLPN